MATKKSKIEKYLIDNKSITSIEAINLCLHTRLADVIFILKNQGWRFHTENIPQKSGGPFAKYHLLSTPPGYATNTP